MKPYASFCPVAKTAEVFAERWTPLLLRELCMGARRFTDLQKGLPLISRATLTQRLGELEAAGVVERVSAGEGARSEYKLTEAGEAFRPILEMMSEWGQTYGRGRISAGDFDPAELMWGMRRYLDVSLLPPERLVVQFEFSGMAEAFRNARYWWLVLRRPEIDVCLKNPGYDVDVVVTARLQALSLVWLGYRGLVEARRAGEVAVSGPAAIVATVRGILGLHDHPWNRKFDLSMRDDPFGPPPGREARSRDVPGTEPPAGSVRPF